MAKITTINTPYGKVQFVHHPLFDEPHSPTKVSKLIPPYFSGTGKDFGSFMVFHEGPALHPGLIMACGKVDIRVMANSAVEEDFFEDIYITTVQIVTNDSRVEIDINTRVLEHMYSAATK